MTTYVDASALLKRYIAEADSDLAQQLVSADTVLVTSWVTVIEVRRNLARVFSGSALARRREAAEADFDQMALVVCDAAVCVAATAIAETLAVRSLDAVHLASAQRLMIADLSFVTFDLRQGQAARSLGMHVLGC